MAVVIEELEATVAAPAAPAPAGAAAPAAAALDEQRAIELIALETWARRRLVAD